MIAVQTISEVIGEQSAAAPWPRRQLSASDLTLTLQDPLRDGAWDRLIESHPDATFFHSSSWAKVLCSTYRHRPAYLRFLAHGQTAALVPMMEVRSPFTGRRGVCLPFSDACEPLIFQPDAATLVLDKLTELACNRQWKFLELRGRACVPQSQPSSVAFYGHTLDLRGGTEQLFAHVASSVRRAIRKAESSNLNVQISFSRKAIAQFYRLHLGTRRRHGLPPQPFSFFEQIHEQVVKPEHGFVVVAEDHTGPIAAAIFFRLGHRAVYKFGASHQPARHLRCNNLVMWEAIKFLAEHGTETLHFGRTSQDAAGLRRFKLAWGAEEEVIEYFRFNTAEREWVSFPSATRGFHHHLFRAMPLPLNQLAGSILYPHLD